MTLTYSPPLSHATGEGRFVHARLLDVDPDLGDGLPEAQRREAEAHAVLPAVMIEAGVAPEELLAQHPAVRGHVHGWLIASGALAQDVELAGRNALRLFTAGEIALLDHSPPDSIDSSSSWAAVADTRAVVLDERFIVYGRRWPGLLSTILDRVARQARQAQLQQVISHLPRSEDRLIGLFWVLSDRIGVVRRDGVHVALNLTHESIARMIGTRRQTVTISLRALAAQGLLARQRDGWLIARESLDRYSEIALEAQATAAS